MAACRALLRDFLVDRGAGKHFGALICRDRLRVGRGMLAFRELLRDEERSVREFDRDMTRDADISLEFERDVDPKRVLGTDESAVEVLCLSVLFLSPGRRIIDPNTRAQIRSCVSRPVRFNKKN